MNANLTDITIVVDRSGSMDEKPGKRADAEGGLNSFIEDQKSKPGDMTLTLVQFDTTYEFIHQGVPIRDVPRYELRPRGGTALLDAVGRAINETGARLAAMPEADRPGLVFFLIVTDGQENSSREFNKAQVKQMIEHQQAAYKWEFTFLGAGIDAFAEAGGLGIATAQAGNIKNFTKGYEATSGKLGRMRMASAGGQSVSNTYTDEEKKLLEEE